MIFELVKDFGHAIEAMPSGHAASRSICLLENALRRDVHFIDRHVKKNPQALFQCLWNSCWSHDSPQTAEAATAGKNGHSLSHMLAEWRTEKESLHPGLFWLRSMHSPSPPAWQQMVLRGHRREISSVCGSPDGRRIASASLDSTIRIWDSETGGELRCLAGHNDWVWSVAYSPSGRWFASASYDKTVAIWDAESGALINRLAHNGAVRAVAYSPQDGLIATGTDNGAIFIWNVENSSLVANGKEHSQGIESIAWSADGQWIASASSDFDTRLWNVQECVAAGKSGRGATAKTLLKGHIGPVQSVTFHPTDHRIATAAGTSTSLFIPDNTIRLWNSLSGQELLCCTGHSSDGVAVAFSPSGKQLTSSSWDGTVRLWDASSGQPLAVFRGHVGPVRSAAWLSDSHIVSGGDDLTVRVWETEGPRQSPSPEDGQGKASLDIDSSTHNQLAGVAFSSAGDKVFGRDHAGQVWEFDVQSGTRAKIDSPVESPHESFGLAGASPAGFAQPKHLETIVLHEGTRQFAWFPAWLHDASVAKTGKLVAGNSGDGTHLLAVEGISAPPTTSGLLRVVRQEHFTDPAEALNFPAFDLDPTAALTTLRATGQIPQAVQCARLALAECFVGFETNDEHVAITAGNLSEVLLLNGDIAEAIEYAQMAVTHAEKSGNPFHRMSKRTTLACALHQAGSSDQAGKIFRDAEEIQKRMQPQYPILNLLWGYRYCDYLLDQGHIEEVVRRGKQLLAWRESTDTLVNIALDHLVIGKAILLLKRQEDADEHLDFAVRVLEVAGRKEWLSLGLLARAALRLDQRSFYLARADLNKVCDIALRGNMLLYQVDGLLIQARLHATCGDFAKADACSQHANSLIQSIGYYRRGRPTTKVSPSGCQAPMVSRRAAKVAGQSRDAAPRHSLWKAVLVGVVLGAIFAWLARNVNESNFLVGLLAALSVAFQASVFGALALNLMSVNLKKNETAIAVGCPVLVLIPVVMGYLAFCHWPLLVSATWGLLVWAVIFSLNAIIIGSALAQRATARK